MKRKLLLLSLTLLLAFSGIVYAAGVNGSYKGHNVVKVTLDGKEIKPDGVPGYLDGDYTMVPLGLLRKMGITVEWDAKRLTANAKVPTRTVSVLIKSQLDELSKSVYEVWGSTSDPTKFKQGSGFLVGSTFITNYHVAGDSSYAQVKIDGNYQKVTSYLFANKEVDLMGFTVTGGHALPVSTDLPQKGDPVYDISFPHGVLTVTEGEVYGLPVGPNGVTQISHSAKIDGGSSGGMLLNGKGEIIGINRSVMYGGSFDASFAIPVSFVVDEINK